MFFQPANDTPNQHANRHKPVSLSRVSGRMLVNGYQAQSRQGVVLDSRLVRLLRQASLLLLSINNRSIKWTIREALTAKSVATP
jgi:hypothetical protein